MKATASVNVSNEGSGETAHMCRLAWALGSRRSDNYKLYICFPVTERSPADLILH